MAGTLLKLVINRTDWKGIKSKPHDWRAAAEERQHNYRQCEKEIIVCGKVWGNSQSVLFLQDCCYPWPSVQYGWEATDSS